MMSFLEKNVIFGNMVNDIKRIINIDEDTTSLIGQTTSSSDEAIKKQSEANWYAHKTKTNPSQIIKARTEDLEAKTKKQRVDNTEERNKILAADAKNKRIETELANPGRQKNKAASAPIVTSLTQS